MRRRLWKFLPIVLMALAVQIFAPIGACWAASIAASDPLHAAPICSGGAALGADQTGQTGEKPGEGGLRCGNITTTRTKTVIATGAKSNDTFNASYVCKEPETAAD